MQHLIKVSNIAIQNLNKNENINTTQQPLNLNGLVQLKIVGIDDNVSRFCFINLYQY